MEVVEAAFGDVRAHLRPPWSEAVLVVTAFLCGVVVGGERERHEKPAGLRTMVLICLGSAIFTLASVSPALGGHEPARVAAQIVTGVGFLGAGTIVRARFGITGLTTAATVWATAAIGIVVGAGYAAAGLALSIGVLITLAGIKRLEDLLGGPCRVRHVRVVFHPDGGKTRAVIERAVDETPVSPSGLGAEVRRTDGTAALRLAYCASHREHRALLAAVAQIPGVQGFEPAEEEGG